MNYTSEIKDTIDRMRVEDGEPPLDGGGSDPRYDTLRDHLAYLEAELDTARQKIDDLNGDVTRLLDDINDMVEVLEARESMSAAISIGRDALEREGY